MEGKERKRADDLPAGAVDQVRELLNRPRSSADFSPAARYAVSKLCDYAEQEHELRGKAEERCVKMNGQVTDARLMVEALSESVRDGYVSAPDLIRVLREEYEIDIIGG